ncbi:MAG: hypothetical protein ABIE84_06820 [bacterium]
MLNLIDLVLGIFIAFYYVKNAGGMITLAKNTAIVLVFLMVFGVFSQFVISLSFTKPLHVGLQDSYLVKVSRALIRWSYPAIEWSAPKIDAFIKDKVLSEPAPEIKAPKVTIPKMDGPSIVIDKNSLPKLNVNELPKLK